MNENEKASWRVDWDQVQDLGRIPDARLARRLGVSAAAVGEARRARGIPVHEKRRNRRPEPLDAVWVKVDPLLGQMPDTDIARRYGLSAQQVRARRARLDIPRWCA